jgi:hypothetical protein
MVNSKSTTEVVKQQYEEIIAVLSFFSIFSNDIRKGHCHTFSSRRNQRAKH